jgi:NADPH:quinone reductase-like Zn-dependent oxidoreductase
LQIYATVGTQQKVDYLTQNLDIPPDRIFDSRSASFKSALMKATNDRGVDVVLNSLAGGLLHASWDCVAPHGKFIELGKRDMLTNGMLTLKPFLENRAFFGLDITTVLEPNSKELDKSVTVMDIAHDV